VAPLLREVRQLDPTACDRHALELWQPSTEQLLAAGAKRGPLSFLDRLCLVVARDEGWTCATNDKALRQVCKEEGVRTRWGLELLIDLVEARRLETVAALGIATEIHLNNRYHITAAILARFRRRLAPLGHPPRLVRSPPRLAVRSDEHRLAVLPSDGQVAEEGGALLVQEDVPAPAALRLPELDERRRRRLEVAHPEAAELAVAAAGQ
jgi:hypothetical protein